MFCERTNAPCSSNVKCIIFRIRLVYYNTLNCFFYCDLDLHGSYHLDLHTRKLPPLSVVIYKK